MTDELKRQMESDARRRNRIIRKKRGIRYGDGYSIRCLGRFRSTAGKVYFLYEISNVRNWNFKTGLRTFDLFEDDVIDIYRPATYDEMMEIMHGEWMEVLAD